MSKMQVSHQNQAGVSIIICCYNSAKKLPETIKHLSLQKNLKDIKCELVIIDNASKDGTAELAGQLCREYVHNIPFKIFFESNPGLSNARKRGIKEAQYELLLFCDDDNWLNQDYLQIAYDIMMQNNIIGVLGNQCIGEYEVAPPGWFLDNAVSFAIGKQGDKSGDITDKKGSVWGAGFIVRKSIFQTLQNNGFEFLLSGRKGDALTTGEDRELCLAVRKLGYRIYYEEKLVAKHYMPASRFNYENFLKLSYQNGKISFIIDAYNNKIKYYIPYLVKTIFIAIIKLTTAYFIFTLLRLSGKTSSARDKSERRVHYFSGKLNSLLNFSYSKTALETIRGSILNKNKIAGVTDN